jgi:glucosamine-6-phosphate deaminase
MDTIQKALEIFSVDNLEVRIYSDREVLGKAAAENTAACIQKEMSDREIINMVFASAPSQEEFLKNISTIHHLDWQRIVAFHMDEYLGLPPDSLASFGMFLRERLFNKVQFHKVHYMDSYSIEPEKECARYSTLLQKNSPIEILIMGIGENGHIAFNDPQVSDFDDPKIVKIVQLDQTCKQQQVNDGCFKTLNEVPGLAMTMTIPTLVSGKNIFCIVPGSSKAEAVHHTLTGKIDSDCPASILRKHQNAILYLDKDSAKKL